MTINKFDLSQVNETFLANSIDQWLSSKHCLDINCTSRDSFIESNFNSETKNGIIKVATKNSSHGNWLIGLRNLDWDTNHFGIKMAKLSPFILPDCNPADSEARSIGESMLNSLLNTSDELGVKHLTTLVHSKDSLGIQLLSSKGFELMDTTVMYELDLKNSNYNFQSCNQIRLAKQDDLKRLETIAIDCFANRNNNINRFNSDPYLNKDKVKKLYSSWVANSIQGDMADELFVFESGNQIAGFLSIQKSDKSIYGSANDAIQIPINAVAPEFKGQGIYRKLVENAIAKTMKSGNSKFEIWTHVSNTAVHKVWQSFGAVLCLSGHQLRRCQGVKNSG